MPDKVTTKQVPNPTGKGGFGDNPDNRSDGGWRKEMVFSYQYKRFMNMTLDELNEYNKKPESERTVVEDLAYKRIVQARNSLMDVKEITDRTEGKAPQSIEHTGKDGAAIEQQMAITYMPEPLDADYFRRPANNNGQ